MSNLRMVMRMSFTGVLILATAPAIAATVAVTNNNDSGQGSFRAAVEAANADPSITGIQFQVGVGTIVLGSSIEYLGAQSLSIDGKGATVDGAGWFDVFISSGGGDLSIRELIVQNGRNGILVDVPGAAEGEVSVSLFEVVVRDNSEFGLRIDDLTNSSAASIGVDVAFSAFTGNGLSAPDLDGFRVDEGGDGDVMANVQNSVFTGNGADGLELDESGAGDVTLTARGSAFDGNGLNPDDTDDGVDIDEQGDGSVWFRIVQSTFNDNSDDGIDMDEDGNGDMFASLIQVEASRMGDKGVNLAENGPGDFTGQLNLVLAEDNGDVGLRMREFGSGNFDTRLVSSTTIDNADFDIEVREVDAGAGELRLQQTTFGTINNPDGIEVTEVGASS